MAQMAVEEDPRTALFGKPGDIGRGSPDPNVERCPDCWALVQTAYVSKHREWHDRFETFKRELAKLKADNNVLRLKA